MVTRRNSDSPNMFRRKRTYCWAFVGYILCITPMIRAGIREDWFLHSPNASPRFIDIIGSTFCMAFLVSMIRKTSSILETSILIGSAIVCALWFLRILAAYEIGWLQVPANFAISAFIAVVVTFLVGIRALQAMLMSRVPHI